MGHLEGNFTPVLYIGNKVPKGSWVSLFSTYVCISNVQHKRMSYILKQIKQKHVTGNAILTQADKGRTMVIITQDSYADTVHTFQTNSNFPSMPKYPTAKYHNLLQITLQECNFLIEKQKIKYIIQKKLTPPTFKARIKLHKQETPIRKKEQTFVVGSKCFRPDIQKPRQMENTVRDI